MKINIKDLKEEIKTLKKENELLKQRKIPPSKFDDDYYYWKE